LVGRPRALIPLALALTGLGLVWVAMLRLGGSDLDRNIFAALYVGGRGTLYWIARVITEMGAYTTLLALTLAGLIVLLSQRLFRKAWLLAGLIVTGPLFVELQKGWIGRLRPNDELHLMATQSYSFPSGHTANATLMWLSFVLLFVRGPRTRMAALGGAAVLAVAIGFSRVMLGVHWPTDVVAGWALGVAWLLLLFRLAKVPLRPS
jgi:membrane-associated phospholipid phosphatase